MDTESPQIQIIHQDQEEDTISFKEYWAALKRRWWLIFLTFVIVVALTGVYLSRQSKMYQATAVVKIPSQSGGGLAATLGVFLPFGRSSGVTTEIEMIKLRSIAEKVIKELELDKKEINQMLDWRQIVFLFQAKLRARQRGSSDLIEIMAVGDSPEEARDIANAVAAEYILVSEAANQKQWNDLIGQMEAKLKQVKIDLETSTRMLHEQEAVEGIPAAFSLLLTRAGTSVGGTQYMLPDAARAVVQLKSDIAQMEIQRDVLLGSVSESDPNVIRLENQIAISTRKLEQAEEELIDRYNKQFNLTGDAANVVFNQQLYATLVTKQEELKAQHIMQNKSPEIIEEAEKPLFPSKPRKALTLMVGGMLGLFLGLGIALFREYRDNSMHTAENVTSSIDVPVFGKLPSFGIRDRKSGRIALINDADSFRSDRFRAFYKDSCRTLQLELMATVNKQVEHEGGLTLLLTSSVPGEGTSTIAANLAVSIAQTGKKVLLVDTDCRDSAQHKPLGMDADVGLIDILTESASWDDVVRNTSENNLCAIPAGGADGQFDLSALLMSPRLEDFIELSRKSFDVVIFDSSPATSPSESAAIGSKVDGVVLVIKANHTQKDDILQAKQRIQNSGGNILGAVLNCVRA